MTAQNPLWLRLPNEGDEAFSAFTYYLHMPRPRKLDRYGMISMVQVNDWYHEFAWSIRARAFDDHLAEAAAEEKREILSQSNEDVLAQHLALLGDMRQMLAREAARWNKISSKAPEDFPTVTKVGDLIKLTDTVVKLDRLVRDQSTEKVDNVPDLSHLSVDELRAYNEIMQKAKPRE